MEEQKNEKKEEKGKDIRSLLPSELEALLLEYGEPKYRAGQIFSRIAKGDTIAEMTCLSKNLRAKLESDCGDYSLSIEKKLVSSIDGTVKYLFRLFDGEYIESVLMKYKHGNTICISSQVGCRMGCRFCASTIGGRVRNLLPSEMLGQIIMAEKDSGERISNVVMMGIGEPLDNYENVNKFLQLVNCEGGLNIGYRHISLSTCGLADKIRELAKEKLPITLSISLHATTDESRSSIMPINNKYNIDELLSACVYYYEQTKRRISFEYTLISGKNDTPDDAKRLSALLKRYFDKIGAPIHVNLIRVNEVEESGFKRGDRESVMSFAEILNSQGVTATVRRRLGSDVNASCGQLRRGMKKDEK